MEPKLAKNCEAAITKFGIARRAVRGSSNVEETIRRVEILVRTSSKLYGGLLVKVLTATSLKERYSAVERLKKYIEKEQVGFLREHAKAALQKLAEQGWALSGRKRPGM